MTSIHSEEYKKLLDLLVGARKTAGVTQQQVADALGLPQSFVSKYENGERRLDVIEFLAISRLLKADPYKLLRKIERELPEDG